MRLTQGFWGTGEKGYLFQGNKGQILRGTGERRQYWGTWNIRKTNFRFFGNRETSQIISREQVQYTKRRFTIFHVGFGVATLCLAQSRWFHGDGHREFQVNQRDSQRDEERGVIIDFREMGCFIATPCLYVSEREIPCLYVSEREIYDLLFTFAISTHGRKVQLTAYAQKPS